MCREAVLAFPDELAANDCPIVTAPPWIYGLGQQTDNGAYLSPVNAVAYLAGKLASLAAWKKYRVALNRLDLSAAPDITWPEKPH